MPNNRAVKMNIWDTAGQEKYRAINRNLYLGAQGALLCFDLTRKLVNDDIDLWRKEVQEHASSKCCIVIVGTKADKEEVLPETRALLEAYSKMNGFQFVETSSKTGSNVQEAFKIAVSEILLTKDPKKPDRAAGNGEGFGLVPDVSKNNRRNCCS